MQKKKCQTFIGGYLFMEGSVDDLLRDRFKNTAGFQQSDNELSPVLFCSFYQLSCETKGFCQTQKLSYIKQMGFFSSKLPILYTINSLFFWIHFTSIIYATIFLNLHLFYTAVFVFDKTSRKQKLHVFQWWKGEKQEDKKNTIHMHMFWRDPIASQTGL